LQARSQQWQPNLKLAAISRLRAFQRGAQVAGLSRTPSGHASRGDARYEME